METLAPREKNLLKKISIFPTGLCHLKKVLGSPTSSGWAASRLGRWLRHLPQGLLRQPLASGLSYTQCPHGGPLPSTITCRIVSDPCPQIANADITNRNWGLLGQAFTPLSFYSISLSQTPSFLIPTLAPIHFSQFIHTTGSIHSPPSFSFYSEGFLSSPLPKII